jgi:hypothetical protein
MDERRTRTPQMFRLWIATYSDWRPTRWNESPPQATALELVEDAVFSADEAALFLEGFNSSMLSHGQRIWAVAIPVTVRYDGDVQPGVTVRGFVFAEVSTPTEAGTAAYSHDG